MNLPSFEKCVGALTETIAQQDPLPPTSEGSVTVVAGFVMATHARMPDYMRFGSRILVLAFDAWSYPTSGRPFHRLDVGRRHRQLSGWEFSRFSFPRSLIALFRALVTFGLATERDKNGQEALRERTHRQSR